MAYEIERKFLVVGDAWRRDSAGRPVPAMTLRQGYMFADGLRNARVRMTRGPAGDSAFLTIKGPREGLRRFEFEYPIPVEDAAQILDHLCPPPLIEKTRHHAVHAGMTWEVDEFSGLNAGLIMAEIELQRPDQAFEMPPWIGREVTQDGRYYNSWLATHPYSTWAEPG